MSSSKEHKNNNTEKSEDPQVGSNSSSSSDPTDEMNMERLQRYLAEKLGFKESDEEKIKVLDEVSLDGIVQYIKTKNCTNIVTMAGAGISTSAGIPDFRSPGTGLYDNLQKYNLPHPQAIFELDFFYDNPKPFFVLAKELYPGSFKPTVCHYFIRLLIEKNVLLRHYTQNIDTLERVAGIPEDKIVEAHGTFYTGHCLECRTEYSLNWMKDKIFNDEIPTCEKCPGVVKPDIVFFGENLPSKFHNCLKRDFDKCDLLIVLGSSLVVQPFASLVERVKPQIPRLLINREKAGHKSGIMAMLGMGGGMDFDSKDNSRDVAWLGNCDEGCQLLADKLGWGDELRALCKREHERIDKENTKEKTEKPQTEKEVEKQKTAQTGTKQEVKEEKGQKTAQTEAKQEVKKEKKPKSGEQEEKKTAKTKEDIKDEIDENKQKTDEKGTTSKETGTKPKTHKTEDSQKFGKSNSSSTNQGEL